jgi:hypothetical protein
MSLCWEASKQAVDGRSRWARGNLMMLAWGEEKSEQDKLMFVTYEHTHINLKNILYTYIYYISLHHSS